jgi:hypothetical protein
MRIRAKTTPMPARAAKTRTRMTVATTEDKQTCSRSLEAVREHRAAVGSSVGSDRPEHPPSLYMNAGTPVIAGRRTPRRFSVVARGRDAVRCRDGRSPRPIHREPRPRPTPTH